MKRVMPPKVWVVVLACVFAGCGDAYQTADTRVPTTVTGSTVQAPPVEPKEASHEGREEQGPGRLTTRQRRVVRAAKRDARRFLVGYLSYSYGKRTKVRNVFPGVIPKTPLRPVPSMSKHLRPRLVKGGLTLASINEGEVILLARIDDGDVPYAMVLTMRHRGHGWAVGAVD